LAALVLERDDRWVKKGEKGIAKAWRHVSAKGKKLEHLDTVTSEEDEKRRIEDEIRSHLL